MARLAEKFVCVRIQSMNGVNLNQFQFEYDLTWMSFFQNAAGRTYARYGGREDDAAESQLTKASLLRVMQQVLALHAEKKVQPASRYEPVATATLTPEDLPQMKRMMAKRKESCIHCHDVKFARLKQLGEQGKLEKTMVYTYPSPKIVGILIDPDAQNVVQRVEPKSAAATAGLRAGDVLQSAQGQWVLTFGDFARVLELMPGEGGLLTLKVQRDGKMSEHALRLTSGWRKSPDPSWRESKGAVGPNSGFWGKRATVAQRKQLGLTENDLGVRVTFIWGQWARKAGLRNGDMVVSLDGVTHDMGIRQLQTFLQMNRNWGDAITLGIRRGGKSVTLKMQLPSGPRN